MKAFIRLLAFFAKETNEVRRQPRLVLSLILGPFLILLLFGLGYMNQRPPTRISLVIPPELRQDARVQAIQTLIQKNFMLMSVHETDTMALDELRRGVVELVEQMPADSLKLLEAGQQVPLKVIYNDIDPQNSQYLEYIGYVQVDRINTSLLLETISALQGNVSNARQQIGMVRNVINRINQHMTPQEIGKARQQLQALQAALGALETSPIAQLGGQANVDDLKLARQEVEQLDQALAGGQAQMQQERVQQIDAHLAQMDDGLGKMEKRNPVTIVAPVKQEYQNLQKHTVDMVLFFAPSVLALILQHIAVTLGALSLVRERVRGALEFFGVAPINILQVLVGKYLAYILFLGMITSLLTGLLIYGLRVPFLGNVIVFTAFTLLYLAACVGVGFLVSALSSSENQAIQLSMLILLLSIFFSGFIMPLDYFRPWVRIISAMLPVSHAIVGYRAIMLMGNLLPPNVVFGLSIIAVVTFGLVLVLWGRHFRRLA